jgi:DNA-binding response OmpR family regulator
MAAAKDDVLVVEDDPEINEMVGAYAQLAGFDYRAALDGGAALEAVRERVPSVIILDLMLPDLDGFEVCRRVRSQTRGGEHRPPIIILTALDGDSSRQQGMLSGADEYLTKPFDPDQLMEVIARHVAGRVK